MKAGDGEARREALTMGRNKAALPAGRLGATDIPVELAAVLAPFITFLRAMAREEARAIGDGAGDVLLRSDKLGPQNRIVVGMIQRGELPAVKIGNRWHVRRSTWEKYVADLERRQREELRAAPANDAAPDDDEVDAAADRVLAELGLERKAPRVAGRGRR